MTTKLKYRVKASTRTTIRPVKYHREETVNVTEDERKPEATNRHVEIASGLRIRQ